MIICLCTGASDRDVHNAIDRGVASIEGFRASGIGTGCGECHRTLEFMLEAQGVAASSLCTETTILDRIAARNFAADDAERQRARSAVA